MNQIAFPISQANPLALNDEYATGAENRVSPATAISMRRLAGTVGVIVATLLFVPANRANASEPSETVIELLSEESIEIEYSQETRWLKFQAPAAGVLILLTHNSTADVSVRIYSSSNFNNPLRQIDENRNHSSNELIVEEFSDEQVKYFRLDASNSRQNSPALTITTMFIDQAHLRDHFTSTTPAPSPDAPAQWEYRSDEFFTRTE